MSDANNAKKTLYAVERRQSNGNPYSEREFEGAFVTFRKACARADYLSCAMQASYTYRIIEFNEGREMPK